MKRMFLVLLCLLVIGPTTQVFAEERIPCPGPDTCPAGHIRYVPGQGYEYWQEGAELSGDNYTIEWLSTRRIDYVCIGTGEGLWSFNWLNGKFISRTAEICEVVLKFHVPEPTPTPESPEDTFVPEPLSMTLMSLGLGMLAGYGAWKKRK